MRISQLSLAGRGAWPDLHISQLHPELNVFFGKPGAGKSTIVQLVNHLLYGKNSSPWRQQFGQAVPLTEGQLLVESSQGNFVLRRHLDPNHTSRLTVAAVGGGAVDSRTVQKLLSDLSPQVISQLVAVDFAESPSVEWVLQRDFTRELAKTRSGLQANTTQFACPSLRQIRDESSPLDRRRIDELISQRDAIAQAIETQLAVRRREGDVLVGELKQIEADLEGQRRSLEIAQGELPAVVSEIATCEMRLRYVSLAAATMQQHREKNLETQRRELSQLELEVTRCRKALAELQSREAAIRAELAQLNPDGTADRAGYFVDTRSTLNVLERLLEELDAEVALLARSPEPARCLGHDSHAKLSPVASLLRQQVYSLCGLVSEQERHARWQQLTAESRQLSRTLMDMGDRLEQLLQQRERLLYALNEDRRVSSLLPHGPVVDHCQCEHHGEFTNQADSLLIGSIGRASAERELRSRYEELVRNRGQLLEEIARGERDLAALEARWQGVQRQRAGFVGNNSVEENQFELERLDILIRQSLKPIASEPPISRESWRASDILAQLTDGQFVQIRLGRGDQSSVVIDRAGQPQRLGDLSTSVHDQLYLALTLALVGAFSRRGIHLPVILDEPFLRQNAASSAILAGVLAEFARYGHQLLVFTEDLDALRRFESLNCQIFDIAKLRQPAVQPASVPPVAEQTLTRVVRETEDGRRTPVLQLRTGDTPLETLHLLSERSTLAEFPVLGSITTEVFHKIGIQNVGELLRADAAEIARRLGRNEISPDTVRLWQAHMTLMCNVPGLTLNDAQVLRAVGIRSPAQLRDAVPIELEGTIRDFLKTDRGQRFANQRQRYHASQLREWAHSIREQVPAGDKRGGRQARRTIAEQAGLRKSAPSSRASAATTRSRELRYFLELNRSTEDAPGIGPKTAGYLAKVGIRTVADLLRANPTSTAIELAIEHISETTITHWQQQARLMCRIPELRGYGAQILVACGFTTAEQIAGTSPQELVTKVQNLCGTKAGKRILQSLETPTTDKIRRWAENAARCRPLEAA